MAGIKAPVGGGNRVIVWGLTTPYTAPTSISGISGMSYMLFDKNESTTATGDVRIDSLTMDLTSKIRNNDYVAFKNATLVNATITTNTQTYEDGSEDKFTTVPSTAAEKRVVVAHIDGAAQGGRIVTIFTALVNGANIGSGRAANTLGDANIQFVSVPAPTTLTIPTNFFAAVTELITASTAIVIPGGCHGTELMM